MDLTDLYSTFPSITEYIFSSTYGTFSRIDSMLGHKTSLIKFGKMKIISSTFFDHSGMKQINNEENSQIHGN